MDTTRPPIIDRADAQRVLGRAAELGAISEMAGGLTRVYLSPEQARANALVLDWMREAGMRAELDAVGNCRGRYEGEAPGAPCLMLGSHLDTVRDAGRYDGMLGVLAAIQCVAALGRAGRRLPFAIEVMGFADEEGVRFGTTFLGSRALAGRFGARELALRDRDGITLAEALRAFGLDPARAGTARRARGEVLAYAELHIEQGPVLESEGLPVGVVTAINGGTRHAVTLRGMAGHAGTVPMGLRRDALAGAAECVLAVERLCAARPGVVGTVGRLEPRPGAINVIPGEAFLTLDIRAPADATREEATEAVLAEIGEIARRRGLAVDVEALHEVRTAACAPWLMAQLAEAVRAEGLPVRHLPSGAGHDGMALAAIADIAMLFVRCRDGVSHNPVEAVTVEDVEVATRALLRFVEAFRPKP